MVPGLLVPHNLSPIDWSLWTNGPQPILSPWTNGPQKLSPHGKMVLNQFVLPRQMVLRIFHLSRGTGCGDPEIWGPNWLETICPREPNFGGPFVHGHQIWWGLFVQGDRIYGDRLSRGKGSGGPEVPGSNGYYLRPNASQPVSRDCISRDSALSPYYNHVEYEIKL